MRPHPGDKVRITPGTGQQKQQSAHNFVTDTCDCTSAFGNEGNSFIFWKETSYEQWSMQWQSHGEAYGELGFRMQHLAMVRDEVKTSGEVITQR